MDKRRPVETSEDLVRAFADLFDEIEPETPDEIDAVIREAGFDPDEMEARIRAATEQALARSPLNWRNRTSQELESERDRVARAVRPGDRAGLIEAIKALTRQVSGQIAYAYRNLESMTDEDLAGLLSNLEYLASQKGGPGEK